MKIVVFAHVPPPLHGQSYMVQIMLRGLTSSFSRTQPQASGSLPAQPTSIYHVDAKISDDLQAVGKFQPGKLLRLLRYCLQAIWLRFRYQADVLYIIPAPPRRIPLLRDCLIMLLCRPFYRRLIFHWHASGLGKWLKSDAGRIERLLACYLLRAPDLSVVLSNSLSDDARYFKSKEVAVVANGIPDPCPDFERTLLPLRQERFAHRQARANLGASEEVTSYRVLFLGHCTREKGLFDALQAVVKANERLAGSGVRMHLTVAGSFLQPETRAEFERRSREHSESCSYAGFLEGAEKAALMRESDCLCFPSFYPAEAQPVTLLEAMAFGLTIVTTRWRGIPDLMPNDYPFIVPVNDSDALAEALCAASKADFSQAMRERFCRKYTSDLFLERLREAFQRVAS